MNEWKGPYKCEKCGKSGSDFWRELATKRGYHYLNDHESCTGRIVPYDRRRAAPGVGELVKDLLWAQEFMQQENWACKDLADTDEEVDRRNDFLDAIHDHKRFADLCRAALRAEGGPK